MFSKIVVALNHQPESQRALLTAIDLARADNARLATVSILGDLPAYASFAIVADPGTPDAMKEDRRRFHSELHEKASKLAQEHGVHATGAIVEGREIHAVLWLPQGRERGSACDWASSARLLSFPSMEFRL